MTFPPSQGPLSNYENLEANPIYIKLRIRRSFAIEQSKLLTKINTRVKSYHDTETSASDHCPTR